jgi:CBS domain-containing protein
MNKDIEKLLVSKNTDIKQAMKQLEITEKKILFVIDDQSQLVGSLTDGDIRRWILREGSLQDTVDEVCNKSPHFVDQKYSLEEVKKEMLGKNILCVPVVDKNQKVVELLFWESVFKDDGLKKPIQPLTIPVVIMAGGKGVRLDPFTKVLPKPLIPIGDKTVMEIIIEKFVECGVKNFYVSVNYKSKIIKSYFEELRPSYSIEFIN